MSRKRLLLAILSIIVLAALAVGATSSCASGGTHIHGSSTVGVRHHAGSEAEASAAPGARVADLRLCGDARQGLAVPAPATVPGGVGVCGAGR